jgi:TRAP transporter 4TM/12TM fusion protein
LSARVLGSRLDTATKILGVGTVCFALLYLFGVFNYFGIIIMPVAYAGLVSGLILVLTLWLVPATKVSASKVPWYDWLLTAFAIVPAAYVFLFYRGRVVGSMLASPQEVVLAIMMILVVLETTRRTVGLSVLFITLAFPVYALFANYFPGLLHGPSSSVPRAMGYLFLFNDGIFGTTIETIATVVVAYMLFGQLLFVTGAGKFYIDIALALLGRYKAGAAKSAVVASGLFGSISGSAISNVATTGVITIPLMKSTGYRPELAAAVETAAATGGAIMPPVMGVLAFVIADYIDVPYAAVAVAAAWPAILYYTAILIQVHLEGQKVGLAVLPTSSLPSLQKTIKAGWYFIIPMLVLVYFLMVQRMDAIAAVMYAMLSVLIVSLFKKETRLTPRKLKDCFWDTAIALTQIFPICVGAGLLIGSVGLTGLGIRLSQLLIALSGANVIVLVILTAIVSFIMGTAMAMIPTYILLAILVAPACISMGLNVMAVHLFIMYMSVLAVITPPVAGAAFAAAAIAKSDPMTTGWIACRLAFVAFLVPFVFIFNPPVILQGTLPDILMWVVLSLIFVFALAIGIEGFMFKKMLWLQRAMLVSGGFSLLTPLWHVRLTALGLIALTVFWQWRSARPGPIKSET